MLEVQSEYWLKTPEWWLGVWTAILTIATVALAIFTAKLWRSTRDLVTKTVDTSRTIERAYVRLSHKPPGVDFGEERGIFWVDLHLQVKNFGRTPANVTDILIKHELLPSNQELPRIANYQKVPQEGVQEIPAPRVFLVSGDEFGSNPYVFIITGDALSEVKRGEKCLWLFGYVDYVDKFGERHRAGYARRYQPSMDERRLYKTEEDFKSRSNLIFVPQAGYNYDRPRTEGEGNDWDEEASA